MLATRHLTMQLARFALRMSGLPALAPVEPEAGELERFEVASDRLLAGDETPEEIPLVTLLRWIAEQRGVLFHGSQRGDLETLEPIRLTRDAGAFGDQQAVFAASDPVWAIYFATLQRGGGFHSTKNGSIGRVGRVYPRWYFFSHNEGSHPEGRFGDGWLYVVPRASFRSESPQWRLLDSGQWASPTAVTPLVRLPVSAEDFPFADHVFPHRADERVVTTVLRACRLRSRKVE